MLASEGKRYFGALGVLAECLPILPLVLVQVIVDYSRLLLENSEDVDEVYNRLLKIY